MNKAIFIDKDGTLIDDIPYNVNPTLVRFTEGALDSLKALKDRGYLLIVVSNQSGLAHGYFDERAINHLKNRLVEMFRQADTSLDGFFFCPHHPDGKVKVYAKNCSCRKPKPGMILRAAKKFNIDLQASWMIGDILNDVEAGNRAGCKTILINNGNETEWLASHEREPTAMARNLREAAGIIVHQPALI